MSTKNIKAKTAKTAKREPELGLKGKGVEQVILPDLDKAISDVVFAKENAKEAKEKLATNNAVLAGVIKEHEPQLPKNGKGEPTYRFDDLLITITKKERILIQTATEVAVGNND